MREGFSGTTIIVVVFIVIVAVGAVYFSPKTKSPLTTPRSPAPKVEPANYTEDPKAEFKFTVMGPVVSDEFYRSVVITVSPSARTATVYKTYLNQVDNVQTYSNSQSAFAQFANALQVSGFADQRSSTTQSEVKSSCPTGARYVYELLDNDKVVSSLWATSCGTLGQTFDGNVTLTNQLFQKQIPNINQMPAYLQVLNQ